MRTWIQNIHTFCGIPPRFTSIQNRAIFINKPIRAMAKNFICKWAPSTFSNSSILAFRNEPRRINFCRAFFFFFFLPRVTRMLMYIMIKYQKSPHRQLGELINYLKSKKWEVWCLLVMGAVWVRQRGRSYTEKNAFIKTKNNCCCFDFKNVSQFCS